MHISIGEVRNDYMYVVVSPDNLDKFLNDSVLQGQDMPETTNYCVLKYKLK